MSRLVIPRLHVIMDDVVLTRPDFLPHATAIQQTLGDKIALHVRGRHAPTRQVFEAADKLAATGCCIVNDRIDIALAVGAAGVQLGARSLTVPVARKIVAPGMLLGQSVHGASECDERADFAIAGTIYASATHPSQTPAGLQLVRDCAGLLPTIAIGGVTLERVPELAAAGAHGVAVIRAVWNAPDPVQAAAEFARLLYD